MTFQPFDHYDLETLKTIIYEELLVLPHQRRTFQRGDILFHTGSRVTKMGFLVDGLLRCTNYTQNGVEINPHYFNAGELFPEYLLLTPTHEYIYSLVAEKRSEVIVIDQEVIMAKLNSELYWSRLMLNYLAHRGLMAERWTLANCYPTLKSKIAYMLLEIYQLPEGEYYRFKESQGIIASKLHVSRPMYNQELAKLEREGYIKRDNQQLKILNRQALDDLI